MRGGILGATQRAAIDTERIGKFFLTPTGLSFIATNEALQRTNPQSLVSPQNRTFTPLNIGLTVPSQVAGLRLRRDGLLDINIESGYNYNPSQGGDKYEKSISNLISDPLSTRGEQTPLFRLFNKKVLGVDGQEGVDVGGILDLGLGGPEISDDNNFLYDYSGGAHSVFGIGRTKIKRYAPFVIDEIKVHPEALAYKHLGENAYSSNIEDFRKIKRYDATGNALNFEEYGNHNVQSRNSYGFGKPGIPQIKSKLRNDVGYTVITADKINALDIYKRNIEDATEPRENKDLIKFRVAVVDSMNPLNDNVITFRAFLDAFDDSFVGEWNSHKYNGRAENFYTYSGFDRSINLSFKVAPQTRWEMIPLYRKLNYLAAQTTPEYVNRRMKGVYSRLTVGDWCNELPGFFTSINLNVGNSPWEIRLDEIIDSNMNQLPMVVTVDCSFVPIHNFTPSNRIDSPFILPEIGVTEGQKWHKLNDGKPYETDLIAASVNIPNEEFDAQPIPPSPIPTVADERGLAQPTGENPLNPPTDAQPVQGSGPGSGLGQLEQESFNIENI